jgi:hypothetical protein
MSDGVGLYLWVTIAGGELWRWGYDYLGKEKLVSVGTFPDIGLAKARELHATARSLLAAGADRMAERKAMKNENNVENKGSFQTIAKAWLAHWRDCKSKRHADTIKWRMNSDIPPALSALHIDRIEAPEVVKMVAGI